MIKQQIITGSNVPEVEDKLSCWLSSALYSRLGQFSASLTVAQPHSLVYWGASFFGLDKVTIFQNAPIAERAKILQLCSCNILEEAYAIEKVGVYYMAKMVLLSESTQEQMLYALYSADEVTHLAQISRFLPKSQAQILELEHPLLKFLTDIVDTEDKAVILFVLQVVLEGWSLSHYRSLAIECREPDLSLTLQGFLADESRHHGTGVMLFHQMSLTQSSQDLIVKILVDFLRMMQLRQQSILAAIAQVKGYLSRSQKIRILEELDIENYNHTCLKFLRSLMRNPNSGAILHQLEVRGAFQPLSASECI
ncbi:ferritin-like domain-containing protein [Calothrix sp. UHCC 0171]|uniref:ferritin-like domain-containing protein n=1 Tax=Calothrix sp. UHCC 0171 TaxID=3110245 RepID=UPI002B20E83B|nr:ferritin-like domain-containing protein [Calothrix sp. UHCC 0171]MEA5570434.1 ferritin-like domain-containing protein [Calothrix sp. UHCC 0171]